MSASTREILITFYPRYKSLGKPSLSSHRLQNPPVRAVSCLLSVLLRKETMYATQHCNKGTGDWLESLPGQRRKSAPVHIKFSSEKKKSIKTWGENDCTLDRKKNMTTQQCSVSPAKSLPRFTDFTFKNGFNILIYAIASARKESFSQMRREGVR